MQPGYNNQSIVTFDEERKATATFTLVSVSLKLWPTMAVHSRPNQPQIILHRKLIMIYTAIFITPSLIAISHWRMPKELILHAVSWSIIHTTHS